MTGKSLGMPYRSLKVGDKVEVEVSHVVDGIYTTRFYEGEVDLIIMAHYARVKWVVPGHPNSTRYDNFYLDSGKCEHEYHSICLRRILARKTTNYVNDQLCGWKVINGL